MLIGLYLYLPILSAWLQQASEKSLRLFLLLWGVTLLVPYLTQYATPNLWGTCAWNPYGMLYYFAGFNGYLVAGYYLRHYNRLSGRATAWLRCCLPRAMPSRTSASAIPRSSPTLRKSNWNSSSSTAHPRL